jgi:predicted nucleic acid-binding protein
VTSWPERIAPLGRVSLDTNAVVYFLDRTELYFDLVAHVFERAEAGTLELVLSTLVETELLVGPLRAGNQGAVEAVRLLLDHFPGVTVRPIDRAVARTAAELRAAQRLATPDALIAATAVVCGAEAVIGNDRRCAARLAAPPYLLLSDYVDVTAAPPQGGDG